jgi:hypothetical protein
MTSGNYFTEAELDNIMALLSNMLKVREASPEISIGEFKIYDANGEPLGTVAYNSHVQEFVLYGAEYNPDEDV